MNHANHHFVLSAVNQQEASLRPCGLQNK